MSDRDRGGGAGNDGTRRPGLAAGARGLGAERVRPERVGSERPLTDADPYSTRSLGGPSVAPPVPSARAREPAHDDAPAADTRLRLLVVDDEPSLRRLITGLLRTGFEVTEAASAAEAEALLDAAPNRYHAIVSDLHMPQRSGLEFIAWLHERHPHLSRRVALMTGGALSARDSDFIRCTGLRCLFKPFSLPELRALVAELVGDR